MGKDKKSALKVQAAPVAVTPSGKKVKREAEDSPLKQSAAKKLKKNDGVAQAIEKAKVEVKTQKKKKVEESSSSSDDSSESDDGKVTKVVATKNGSVKAPAKKAKQSSSSESSSEESSSDEEAAPQKKQPVSAKKVAVVTPAKNGKKASSSDSESSDDDDSSSEEEAPVKKAVAAAPAKKVKSDRSSDDSSESDEEPVAKPKEVAAQKVKPSSSSEDESSDDDSSSDEDDKKPKPISTTVKKQPVESSSDESSSESDEDETPKKVQEPVNNVPKEEDSSVSESDSESDDEEVEANSKKGAVKPATKDSSSGSEETSDSDEDSEDEPKKKAADVEMVDAATPKTSNKQGPKSGTNTPQTPITPHGQNTGSKSLFVGNLSWDVDKDSVAEFFKSAGEVVDVRLSHDKEDGSFRGYGHVEFATVEGAQKAYDELNGADLLGRNVRLDFARERGAYTPYSGNDNNSFQKGGGRGQSQTVFVRGFNNSLTEERARAALEKHFGSCGEITRISIPTDRESGYIKGIAYMDFNDGDGFNKALEQNGAKLDGNSLTVEEAKPKSDFRDNSGGGRGGGRFGGGGRSSGGRFGGGGRSGGRDGGRGGGRFSGGRGGGRGRGTPNRPSFTAQPAGKKTKFNDDE